MLSGTAMRLGRLRVAARPRLAASARLPMLRGDSALRLLSSEPPKPEAAEPPKEEAPAPPPPPPPAPGFFSPEQSVAPMDFNRMLAFPGPMITAFSVGTVFGWSAYSAPLMRSLGVVAESSADWSLSSISVTFSLAALMVGVTSFTLGGWISSAGPRALGLATAGLWGGGLLVAAGGIQTQTLPLVYLGYGLLGGVGWGMGYVGPIGQVLKWFPDKRGLASGILLTAFGMGAVVAVPVFDKLMKHFFKAPTFMGTAEELGARLTTSDTGVRMVDGVEAVIARAGDLAKCPPGLQEGVYLVGTGDTGCGMAMASLGAYALTAISVSSFLVRTPPEGWAPDGAATAAATDSKTDTVEPVSLTPAEAVMTPQFWLMWSAVACNGFAGVSIIAAAKTMVADVFAAAYPTLVTSAVTSSYVMGVTAASTVGRFGWATASDAIGRKNTFYAFGVGAPLALSIPTITGMTATSPDGTIPVGLFFGTTLAMVANYGGLMAVAPSYAGDVFGLKHAAPVFGRLLTAWTFAAICGPTLLTTLRGKAYTKGVHDLAAQMDPATFESTFGQPIEKLDALVASKAVTIPGLLAALPPGTLDPTPGLYNDTMYIMGGALATAAVCNSLIRPATK